MREKVLRLFDRITPFSFDHYFDSLLEQVFFIVDGKIATADRAHLPEPIENVRAMLKEKLAIARRSFEDLIVEKLLQHLSETDVDAALAWYQSETAMKLAEIPVSEIEAIETSWRRTVLEPEVQQVCAAIGVVEPAPAPDLPPAA